MTIEELIQTFPECEKIKCEDIAEYAVAYADALVEELNGKEDEA